ncbi:hypothetical protein BH11MYX2_BH11MYX2_00100 [soil metagenome]
MARPAHTSPFVGGAASLSSPPSVSGYQLGALLGRGGMGDILLGRDPAIGREIAVKRLRTAHPSPDAISRFLREAKIQARLEHPSIVPVHAMGTDDNGVPFFTMKRISGITLGSFFETAPSLLRALRIFVEVCIAVDFAHSRAVVHRDLKPQNVMIGDFGEVYVLDWGLARILDERDAAAIGRRPRHRAPQGARHELRRQSTSHDRCGQSIRRDAGRWARARTRSSVCRGGCHRADVDVLAAQGTSPRARE